MRITLIGHGKLPIPPSGWGAVEQVIYDISKNLRGLGHEVEIVNLPHRWVIANLVVRTLLRGKVDYIWCHNERLVPSLTRLSPLFADKFIETCHSPMTESDLEQIVLLKAIRRASKAKFHLSLHPVLSKAIQVLNPSSHIIPFKNGVDVQGIRFQKSGNGRAICLGRISNRKRQALVAREMERHGLPIDFVGPESSDLRAEDKVSALRSYLGTWTRAEVCDRMTEYSVLVLWSKSEVQPLVVLEAMAAGLDVVVSREASGNLDGGLQFVHIVESLEDLAPTIEYAIDQNASRRAEIRAYAEANWDWNRLLADLFYDLSQELESATICTQAPA